MALEIIILIYFDCLHIYPTANTKCLLYWYHFYHKCLILSNTFFCHFIKLFVQLNTLETKEWPLNMALYKINTIPNKNTYFSLLFKSKHIINLTRQLDASNWSPYYRWVPYVIIHILQYCNAFVNSAVHWKGHLLRRHVHLLQFFRCLLSSLMSGLLKSIDNM